MGGRRYRVVERFRWPEGGNPTAEDGREGGESVAYEPGDTVHMEDQDLESMYLHVEALDDAGGAVLEEARAKAKASLRCIANADLSSSDVEFLTRGLDEKRRLLCEIVQDIGVLRDGSENVSTRYVPINPLPGVIYGDDGLPDTWATARQRERLEMKRKLDRIHGGASRGGRQGREAKRDETARADEKLLADVRAHRRDHPSHGRPTIAAALLRKHGRKIDHAADPKKAIAALVKRIERLEKKSLDT
ncbi:MAG TPA: hypothetical protein VF173_14230 [Thermoanaerobaculia bacterium]|nr:hypothetical protein [Thermoanaerobaculia bacterium]